MARANSSRSSGLPPVARQHAAVKKGVRRRTETLLEQPGHGHLAEGRRIDDDPIRLTRDVSENRVLTRRLAAAQSDGDDQAHAFEAPTDVGQEAQRCLIAPVHVVDRQHHRRLRARIHGEPIKAVEDGE
jgi:hypothetical protein